MPTPFEPAHNAIAMALTLPEQALQCCVLELRRGSLWTLPYHVVAAAAKVLLGSACVPATLLFGSVQVRSCVTARLCVSHVSQRHYI